MPTHTRAISRAGAEHARLPGRPSRAARPAAARLAALAALAVLGGCSELVPAGEGTPAMQLSAASLDFTATAGGSSPPSQAIAVANSGGGTLAAPAASVSYGTGSGWLSASVGGSAPPFTVTVQPSTAGLSAGTYVATLSVASDGATNTPQAVAVTLRIDPVAPGSPSIALSASSLQFTATAGGSSPAAQVVTVTNSGGGTLPVPTATVSHATGSGWLGATVSGSAEPYGVTVQPSVAGLAAGTYTATVSVASAGALNSPRTVSVSLQVSPAPTPPAISLSATSLAFTATAGGSSPSPQAVTVTNAGGGTLAVPTATVSYATGSGWLSASVSGSAAPFTVTVQPGAAGLAAGTYTATVSIASTGASNSPRTVSVTLQVAPAPVPPAIALSATSLAFTATAGGPSPASQAVTVTNSGGGTLAAPTTSVSYGSGSGWLTATVSGGAPPYTVTVQPGVAGLAAGTHTATVSIASAGASNSPRTVSVSLQVSPATPPAIALAPTSLTFAATAGGASPAAKAVTVSNAGGGALAVPTTSVSYGSGSGWLTATVSGGAAPYTVTVQPNVAGLAAGIHAATVSIASAGASNSPQGVSVTLTVGAASAWWRPAPGTSWQWQLTGTLDTSLDVQMYDVDLFDRTAQQISGLRAAGRVVICYFSAGSYEDWRPDASSFPPAVIGRSNGWPGENWIDIRAQAVRDIMAARMDLAVTKGCDGVEPDNVDGYTNNTGFPLTAADQLAYNRWLATEAHARSLSIGLKNDVDQVSSLVGDFDWALNEECFQYDECSTLAPFISAGKAVFQVEYGGQALAQTICPQANALNFDTLIKDLDLTAFRIACR